MAKYQQFHRSNSTKQATLCEHHDFIHQTLTEALTWSFSWATFQSLQRFKIWSKWLRNKMISAIKSVKYVHACYVASCFWLFATLWARVYQALLFVAFSRQNTGWIAMPSSGDLSCIGRWVLYPPAPGKSQSEV